MIFPKWVVIKIGIFFLFLLAACSSLEGNKPQPTVIPVLTIPPDRTLEDNFPEPIFQNDLSSQISPEQKPSQTKESHAVKYYLDVELDYDSKVVSVKQTISYTNITNLNLIELPLLVPPAQIEDVFFLEAIQTDYIYPNTTAEFENGLIFLRFEQPLQPNQHIEISIVYQLQLPQGWGSLGYTDRQLLLANWYPLIPPYQETTGWIINPPGRVGEHIVYPLNNYYLNLCLTSSIEELVVAASTPAIAVEDGCYRYAAKDRRNITLGISPYYQVSAAENDLVKVVAYTFPNHTHLGPRSAELAVTSWGTFTDLFGENQRDFLSIVEADIFDGLETDGLIFLSEWYYRTADPSPQNYFELLIIHETAHQWFYGLVHNDQANQPWLDEALSTYCEVLFLELHHPDLVDWWWNFRVKAFSPKGSVDASIYDFSRFRHYIDAVYLRGALFLNDLREIVGDEAFFKALIQYTQLEKDSNNLHSADDFFTEFSQVSEADFSEILKEYFQHIPMQGYNN